MKLNRIFAELISQSLFDEKIFPKDCKLRRVKYLNNIIEQDHRFIKKKVRASCGSHAPAHNGDSCHAKYGHWNSVYKRFFFIAAASTRAVK